MRIQAQIVANSILQRVPAVIVKIRNKRYIFNIPELHTRFMRQNYLSYSHQMNVFFTEYSAQTMGGFITFLHEVMGQHRSFGTHLFFDKYGYDYMEHLSYCMTSKTLPLSYYQFNPDLNQTIYKPGRYRIGINSEKQLRELSETSQLNLLKSIIPNKTLMQEIKKLKIDQKINNCFSKIYSRQQGKEIRNIDNEKSSYIGQFFKDSECQIRYFGIDSEEKGRQLYNYILRPKRITGSPDRQAIRKLGIDTHQVQLLYGRKQISKTYVRDGVQEIRNIKLQQVKLPDTNGPILIILHYNTISNIRSIISNPALQHHLTQVAAANESTSALVHIIDSSASNTSNIFMSPQFDQLVKLFPSTTNHVIYQHNLATQSFRKYPTFYPHIKLSQIVHRAWPNLMPDIRSLYQSQLWQSSQTKKMEKIATQLLHRYKQNGYNVHLYQKKAQVCLSPVRNQGYKQNLSNIPTEGQTKFKIRDNLIKQNMGKSNWSKWQYNYKFDPQVIFLGTSSMLSTYYRNVSGIMIKLPSQNNQYNSVLLDCGEGVYNQIINHFGPQEYHKVLKSLKIIFITHLHADHSTGILSLIQERNNLIKAQRQKQGQSGLRQEDKLFLVIPSNTITWFHSYSQFIQNIAQGCTIIFTESLEKQRPKTNQSKMSAKQKKTASFWQYASCKAKQNKKKPFFDKTKGQFGSDKQDRQQKRDKKENKQKPAQFERDEWNQDPDHWKIYKQYLKISKPSIPVFQNFLKQIHLCRFQPIPVMHCPQSYGIVIEHQSKVKISYSGDCKPSSAFIKASNNSTLLIHEATFTDRYRKDAEMCMHSTDKQAIEIGYNNGSQMTALTHFSKSLEMSRLFQQYAINFSNPDIKEYMAHRSFMACDHINFKLSQMHLLPLRCKQITRNIAINSHLSSNNNN